MGNLIRSTKKLSRITNLKLKKNFLQALIFRILMYHPTVNLLHLKLMVRFLLNKTIKTKKTLIMLVSTVIGTETLNG